MTIINQLLLVLTIVLTLPSNQPGSSETTQALNYTQELPQPDMQQARVARR